MYYQLIDKKSNILKIQVSRNNLMYISDDGIYLNDTLLESTNDYSIALFSGDYAIYGNLNSMKRYSLLSHDIEILDWELSYYWESFENDKVLVSKNRRKDMNGNRIADYYLYNFSNNLLSEIHFTDSPYIKILRKIGLIIRDTILKSLSLLTGEYEWEVDLREYGEIAQIIGICQNQLLVSLSNQNLIGIQVKTGEILWEFRKPQEIRADFTRNAHLDSETGKIYFLTFYDFVEFDIQTYSISQHKSFWTGNFQTTWQFGHSCQQDDYIYFMAGIGTAQFYYWLGVFHISSMEIVWQYQREDQKETFNSPPQVTEHQLLVLDSGGTLHIFEKEQA